MQFIDLKHGAEKSTLTFSSLFPQIISPTSRSRDPLTSECWRQVRRAAANVFWTLLFIAIIVGTGTEVEGQSAPTIVNPLSATGVMPYAPYDGARENIALVFGNVNVQIPLLSLPQRGGQNFTLGIVYDSKVYSLRPFLIPSQEAWTVSWNQDLFQPFALSYWRFSFPTLQATWEPAGTIPGGDGSPPQAQNCLTAFIYTDQSGAKHSFGNRLNCEAGGNAFNIFISDTNDGSFLRLDTTTTGDFIVKQKDGTTVHFKNGWSTSSTTPGNMVFDTIVDTNGNIVTANKSGNCAFVCSITDTVGRVITIGAGFVQYNDVNGKTQKITFNSPSIVSGPTLTLASSFFSSTNGKPVNGPSATNGTTGNLTDSVTIPDGASGLTFTFTYDSLGELIKIQYPSGGYTRYDYSVYNVQWSDADGSLGSGRVDFREVTAKHECRAASGNCTTSTEDTTTYTPTLGTFANSATDVIDSLGNKTHYDFSSTAPTGAAGRETNRLVYSGSSTLLRTIKTTYTESEPKDFSLPTEIDTTLNDAATSQTSKKTITYFPITLTQCNETGFNNPVDPCPTHIDNPNVTKEYGYDGSLLRTTTEQYAAGPSPNLGDLNADHILDRLTDIVITDGSSTFETQYEYDNYTQGLATSGATQHQAAGVRGNITAIKKMLNGNPVTTRYQYDDAGNVVQVTDPLSNSSSYSYADNFAESTCAPANGAAAVYPTTITNALNQKTTSSWNSCNGSAATITDVNSNKTSYGYDALGRLKQASYPDTGSTSYSYNDTPPRSITKTVTSQSNIVTTTVLDGLGRVTQTQLNSDPEGIDYTDTTYDPLGRKATISNPYRSTGDPTYGVTTYQYDALGRIIQLAFPDGTVPTSGSTCLANNVCTEYSGNAATVTDQAGNARRSFADPLGRLVEVDEPGAASAGTDASATLTINGSLRSQPTGTSGMGSVTLALTANAGDCTFTGTMSISIGSGQDTWAWGCGITDGPLDTVVAEFANSININDPLVSAQPSGSIIKLTARAFGSGTNYSLSTNDGLGGQGWYSLTPSGATLTGGADGAPILDSGTVNVTVGSFTASAPYGPNSNSTAAQVAAALAGTGPTGLNRSGSPVNATASGASITLMWNTPGMAGNVAVNATSSSDNTSLFPGGSFSGNTNLTGGQDPFPSGLVHPYITLYTYDALGDLTCAVQKGSDTAAFTGCASAPAMWRPRSYTYDSLSRLLTAINPESGTISYTYDANGNLLQKKSPMPNQTGATTQTTSYCYDGLNRVTGKAYTAQTCKNGQLPAGSAVVTYSYDSGSNGIGHLTRVTDPAGSGSYTYDPLGRIATESRTIAGLTKGMSYAYNLDGSLQKLTYPSKAVITYTPDGAGRTAMVQDVANGINYITGTCGPTKNLACYFPNNSPSSFLGGMSDSFPGITNSFTLNNRLQPVNIAALAPNVSGTPATATVTISGTLNSVLTSSGSAAPAITSSALTSFVASDGSSHTFYEGSNQHIYHLFWNSSGGWQDQDVSAVANSAAAASASPLTSFQSSDGNYRVYYLDANNHVNQLASNGGNWSNQDATTAAGAAAAASNSKLAGFTNSAGNHVYYLGTNQHENQLYWNGSQWVNQDLTSAAGSSHVPASSSSLTGFSLSDGTEHTFYIGTDQHVYQMLWTGSAYQNQDLTIINALDLADGPCAPEGGTCFGGSTAQSVAFGANGAYLSVTAPGNISCTPATFGGDPNPGASESCYLLNSFRVAFAGTGLTSFQDSTGAHVYYVDSQRHTHELFWAGTTQSSGGPWADQDQTGIASPAASATGGALAGFPTTSDQQAHLVYLGQANNHIYETVFVGGQLQDQDLTNLSGTSVIPVSGSALTAFGLSAGNPGHVQYLTSNGHIYHLFWNGSTSQNQDLTAIATTVTTVFDSGIVTLNVGGFNATACFGSSTNSSCTGQAANNTAAQVATALASSINTTPSPATATVNGTTLKLVWKVGGNVTAAINALATTHDQPSLFANPSFTSPATNFSGGTGSGGTNTVFSLNYDFHLGNGDNGNVFSITNNRDSTRSQTFTYDDLNRLISAQNSGTDCSQKTVNGATKFWGNSYGYDAWGNLLTKTTTKCSAENLGTNADVANRLHPNSGPDFGYDAAGNMTKDNLGQTYSYDPENRVTVVNGIQGNATYMYDADGNRVEKSNGNTGTIYWYMTPGVVAESDLSGNLTSEYVFFNGERVARRDFSGSTTSVFYYSSDYLKTTSVITDSLGNIKEDEDYYPWGGELQFVNSDSNRYKYKGDERDNETGLDKMGVRYYSNLLGRLTTPDPLYIETHRLVDPQQLNLYTYGRNNPLRFSDSTGLDIRLDCKANPPDCITALNLLNKRENAQFNVGLDKDNKLTAGDADPTVLSESELALYNAITDTGHTGTVDVVADTGQSEFGTHDGPGKNTVDLGNTSKLNEPSNKGGLNAGTAIAHEALDAYFSVNTPAGRADHLASAFFPGLTPPTGGQTLGNFEEVFGQAQVQQVTDGRGSERIVITLNSSIPKRDLEGKTAAQKDKMFVDAGSRVSKVTFEKAKP